MEVPEYIKKSTESTIGFRECSNKESFKIGAMVAFKTSEEFYSESIKRLQQLVEQYRREAEVANNELRTVANIFSKHADL